MQETFPHRKKWIYLSFCGISPLYDPARRAGARFDEDHSLHGSLVFSGYPDILPRLHTAAGAMLHTAAENISYVKNTAEGLSLIAAGYPFEDGDEVVGYVHEYPSNHYPWILQEQRKGIRFKAIMDNPACLSPSVDVAGRPTGFTLEDLDRTVTKRTRIIALSHVQFTSGFAVDLPLIGKYCRDRGIDLIVDAAQSLGALPLYPEEWGVDAIASSGWKWLMGPIGTGLLYTSPAFRSKIALTMTGADVMIQGQDYLDHTWQPYEDGRKFEYSTTSLSGAVALERCVRDLPLTRGLEEIRDHIFHLHDVFLEELGALADRTARFGDAHRSGILSLAVDEAEDLAIAMRAAGFVCTARAGYLRIAPHIPNTEEDMDRAARHLKKLLSMG